MSVPEEYRKVPRPKNTICKMIGDKCAVIERIGCKRVNGKNVPINGSVVGHIIDGRYVPKDRMLAITLKDYGDYAFAKSCSSDLEKQLNSIYGNIDGKRIYAMALLRCLNPELKDYKMLEAYQSSWLSEEYKDIPMGKDSVSKYLKALGRDSLKMYQFARLRMGLSEDHTVLIDGMLKTNESKVNSFSDFSYKGKIKGAKDISLIIAYDFDAHEQIFAMPYPGNATDLSVCFDFIEKTGVKNCVLIGDKGMFKGETFPTGTSPFFPIKRNSKTNMELEMFKMDEVINVADGVLQCKKGYKDGYFYYSYRDLRREAKEKNDYLKSKARKGNIDQDELNKKELRFGTVTYKTTLDISLLEAYLIYAQRWELEVNNNFYKNILDLSSVREHKDESVIGGEMINTLAVIIGDRMKLKMAKEKVLNKDSFLRVMRRLHGFKKMLDPRNEKAWINSKRAGTDESILTALGIKLDNV